ncbi:ABC transporter permease [Cohnella caldifontis]|uniref:ABC transporter permease n=1 Tax=Cohnella caldifontis TaxID=3027471 RepID=UPI0023ECA651|nr:ABC transporter permease [Cohnella sp. YIM B05605]
MFKLKYFELIRTLAVIFIAMLLSMLCITLISKQPMETMRVFLLEPFSSMSHFGNVIEVAIPLMFTGISVSLLFKMKMFNLGAEGIFFFSGLVAAAVGIQNGLNAFVHPLAAIAAGGVVGAVISVIPGVLKAKWNANELVTSLMFNSILLGVGLYILNYFLRDASAYTTSSYKIQQTAVLARIIPGTRVHIGLIVVLVFIALAHVFLYKTRWGYELRMTGANREFAEYSGIKTGRVIVYVHLLAGFVAGVGGSVEVLGMHPRFDWVALPGYGFDGALVAMLAKNNPAAVVGSAFFLSYIRIGAEMMSRYSDVPAEMIAVIQSVILLLVSADQFLKFWKNRMLLKEAQKNG